METIMDLNLKVLDNDPYLKKLAMERWESGNVLGVIILMSNMRGLAFVFDNLNQLKKIGKYEEALLQAYQAIRTNYSNWSMGVLRFLFRQADIQKLRSAGDPIPDQGIFTLYRGVSGQGRKRRVNGFSWTDLPGTAAWFAYRFSDLPDPAVFTITVSNEIIMACCRDRNENEYLLRLPLPVKPKRLKVMPKPILDRTNFNDFAIS
jgi:hypothetical protein